MKRSYWNSLNKGKVSLKHSDVTEFGRKQTQRILQRANQQNMKTKEEKEQGSQLYTQYLRVGN